MALIYLLLNRAYLSVTTRNNPFEDYIVINFIELCIPDLSIDLRIVISHNFGKSLIKQCLKISKYISVPLYIHKHIFREKKPNTKHQRYYSNNDFLK